MLKWKRTVAVICLAICVMLGGYPVCGKADSVKQEEKTDDVGTKDGEVGNITNFVIDNQNLYEGMDKTYAKGYMPKIKKNQAVIVLPLQTKSRLAGNRIKTMVDLGQAENSPFVYKNYERDVRLRSHETGDKGNRVECYLVTYHLDLKQDYGNGSYPVVVRVSAEDEQGNEVHQDFTVYVTLTDGKESGEVGGPGDLGSTDDTGSTGGTGEELSQFAPRIMIESYTVSPQTVQAGDDFTVNITLVNAGRTGTIKNMLVTAKPDENIELLSKSDSVYVEELGQGKTCQISYRLKAGMAVIWGQYDIAFAMDYADSKGNAYTVQSTVKVTVEQPVKVEIDSIVFPGEMQLGETLELDTQVMNLGRGKIYNVRAVVEADGLEAARTAFIGDIEPGSALSGSTELTAVGLSGNTLYGKTNGRVIFYYEDESGKELSEEKTFETSIMPPLIEKKNEEMVDNTGQWWVIMAVIAAILSISVIFSLMRRKMLIRHASERQEESVEE